MDLGLAGRTAAVAAATSGLGYATAQALLAEGATVAICDVDKGRAESAAGRLGERAVPMTIDLSIPDECERFVVDARAELGGLDILVTNAPGPPPGNFAAAKIADYPKALELNLLSVVRMCAAAVPGMQAQRWGRIVAITSIAVRQPIAGLILSNTARAGATGFLKTLAREIAADGVTVNSVQPGLHATQRVEAVYLDGLQAEVSTIPARRLGQASDFGSVVTFLCSEQASYITGSALPIDGGINGGLQ